MTGFQVCFRMPDTAAAKCEGRITNSLPQYSVEKCCCEGHSTVSSQIASRVDMFPHVAKCFLLIVTGELGGMDCFLACKSI